MVRLADSFHTYGIDNTDILAVRPVVHPPWEGRGLDVTVEQLPGNNITHVYCEGSVRDDGRAGCGVLLI